MRRCTVYPGRAASVALPPRYTPPGSDAGGSPAHPSVRSLPPARVRIAVLPPSAPAGGRSPSASPAPRAAARSLARPTPPTSPTDTITTSLPAQCGGG